MTIADLYSMLSIHVDTYIRFLSYSNEIVLRCPFCGDSIKHRNKGHLYIGQSNDAFLYHCKRAECAATGLVNKSFLEALDITDLNCITEIYKHNLSLSSNNRTKINKFSNTNNIFSNYNFDNIEIKLNNFNKMMYLNQRLYRSMDTKYDNFDLNLNKYRIVLSPKNFIDTYNLYKKLTPYISKKLDILENCCIGFLNMNGSVLNLRSIYKDTDFRYLKIRFNSEIEIYSISADIDMIQDSDFTVNISEGSFDIINISHRLKDQFNFGSNDIFLASNGADYRNKIDYFSKYSGFVNFKIRIFRDSDMPVYRLMKQFKNSIFLNNIEIYSNTLGKDYSEDELFVMRDIVN